MHASAPQRGGRLGAARARTNQAARISSTTTTTSSPCSSLLSPPRQPRSLTAAAAAAAAASDASSWSIGGAGGLKDLARAPLASAARRQPTRRHRFPPLSASSRGGPNDGASDDSDDSDREPDWDEEMSIFKQRTLRPNQLATLREMEGRASLGKVLSVSDGLAVLSGINPDAPLGTALAFVSGAAGVLLWHRSDDLAFAIVLGGAGSVRPGEGVECRVKGVLQLVDESLGPVTRKEFELWQSPADDAELAGRAVDFLGRPLSGFDPVVARASASGGGGSNGGHGGNANPFAPAAPPIGMARTRPLVNEQVPMKSREQIGEALVTGVRAVDALTPVGRGSSLLVVGPAGSGKTALARDAVLGQSLLAGAAKTSSSGRSGGPPGGGSGSPGSSAAASPVSPSPSPGGAVPTTSSPTRPPAPPGGTRVRCFYASTTQDAERLRLTAGALLSAEGAASSPFPHDPNNVTVFASPPTAPLGERLATLCAACAAAERVRDKGGHALVVLDDVSALAQAWEHLIAELVALGPERLREGLVKDAEGRDLPIVPPPSAASVSSAAAGAGAGADKGEKAAGGAAAGKKEDAAEQEKEKKEEKDGDGAAEAAAAASSSADESASGDEGLVEYEGMLVSGAVAQRRGFYSTLFMRAAKVHRALGGGTMTLLPLVPGRPATGARQPGAAALASASASTVESSSGTESDGGSTAMAGLSPEALAERYPSLSDEQRRKLGEALARRAREAADAAQQPAAAAASSAASHELRTEIVEEFISISDGQAVMDPAVASASASSPTTVSSSPTHYALNPRLSVTRIGARAYDRALAELAPQARLELAQADDAALYGKASNSASQADDQLAARAKRLAAALVQPAGAPTPLEETALLLFAVKRGYSDAVPADEMRAWAERAVSFVRQVAPRALREVAATRLMTASAEKAIADALEAMRSAGDGRGGVAAAAAARVGGGGGGGVGR